MLGKYKSRLIILILIILYYYQAKSQSLTPEEYIDKYKSLAIDEMKLYKIPASITLAQALHESSNGNSTLAKEANNHFGIKCFDNWTRETYIKDDDKKDECFRKYNSAEESFRDHSEFIRSRTRYSFLFQYKPDDYISWAKGLKTAGYATNSKYPELLIAIIEKYKLYELDKDGSEFRVPSSELITRNTKHGTQNTKHETQINREIILKNNIKAIIAKNGDNYEDLARELDVFPGQILRYNDLKKTDIINEGEIIYFQPKKRNANEDFHIMKFGETFRDISQEYGIKLKCLLKRNKLEWGSVPVAGEKIYLRKNRK